MSVLIVDISLYLVMNSLEADKVPMLLQVFFAQLILADMNKELKGLRFVTSKTFKNFHWSVEANYII